MDPCHTDRLLTSLIKELGLENQLIPPVTKSNDDSEPSTVASNDTLACCHHLTHVNPNDAANLHRILQAAQNGVIALAATYDPTTNDINFIFFNAYDRQVVLRCLSLVTLAVIDSMEPDK